jgi:hypothetical protein
VLAVINLDTRESKVVAADPDWNIASPFWVNNQRLTFSISKGADATMEDQKGGGLFAVNKDATGFRKLFMTVKEAQGKNMPYKAVTPVERVGGDSNEVYVVNNERGRDEDLGASDVFKLDTNNGRMKLLTFNNPGKVSNWRLDHTGLIRIALARDVEPKTKRIKQTVFHRESEQSEWKSIYEAYADEGKVLTPRALTSTIKRSLCRDVSTVATKKRSMFGTFPRIPRVN